MLFKNTELMNVTIKIMPKLPSAFKEISSSIIPQIPNIANTPKINKHTPKPIAIIFLVFSILFC